MKKTAANRQKLKLDRSDLLLAGFAFVVTFALYVRTLTPGLLVGDSGEFQLLAYLLGNTHPTGYPVYLVMAKVFTFLPFGDVAYRVNLFSACMGALAVALLYLVGRQLTHHRVPAFLGSMIFAISPTFWSQSLIAEIYTSGATFLVGVLLALLWWDVSGKPVGLLIAGVLGGLSLGVHMSVALAAPAVLLFLFLHWKAGGNGVSWGLAFAGAVVGVLLTVGIFTWIALSGSPVNYFQSVVEPSVSAWGLTANDINTPLKQLWFGWSGQQFRSFMFSDVRRVMFAQARDYFANVPGEISWIVVIFSGIGIVGLFITQKKTFLLLMTMLLMQWVFFFNYEIWDLYVFYIPSYLLLILFAISGMALSIEIGGKAFKGIFQQRAVYVASVIVVILVGYFGLWLAFQPYVDAVIAGENPFDFEEYPVYDETLPLSAREVVDALPKDAIVLTDWDMMWVYYYVSQIISSRNDLTFLETYPADDQDDIADSLVDYIEGRLSAHPIFIMERDRKLKQAGIAFQPVHIGHERMYRLQP